MQRIALFSLPSLYGLEDTLGDEEDNSESNKAEKPEGIDEAFKLDLKAGEFPDFEADFQCDLCHQERSIDDVTQCANCSRVAEVRFFCSRHCKDCGSSIDFQGHEHRTCLEVHSIEAPYRANHIEVGASKQIDLDFHRTRIPLNMSSLTFTSQAKQENTAAMVEAYLDNLSFPAGYHTDSSGESSQDMLAQKSLESEQDRDTAAAEVAGSSQQMEQPRPTNASSWLQQRQRSHGDYEVVMFCALPIELACITAVLDEQHDSLPQDPQDVNVYLLGRIKDHNVVLASLPFGSYILTDTAHLARSVMLSFPRARFGLSIGIGGGMPLTGREGSLDIRLGDVVVGAPDGYLGGVLKFDLGKTNADGSIFRIGSLSSPPPTLLAALTRLRASHMLTDSAVPQYLKEMLQQYPKLQTSCRYQGEENDTLFEAAYTHQGNSSDCTNCDTSLIIARPKRPDNNPVIHYGTIGSSNQVLRDGLSREKIAADSGILCFDMEAAGLMQIFPCVIIRGICDYADSHKNKRWQPYAAAVAAAFAKELLSFIPISSSQKDATS